MGYRFRLHRRDLPGSPDIVMPRYHIVVFVHGCFWHRHLGCKKTTTPKQNADFWLAKFERNKERDAQVECKLAALGWKVVTIWQCEAELDVDRLADLISTRVEVP
jgi:DNA mismatch endonuclease (patch repair protein)